MNARGNVHPCIYESPHSSTFGFWLIFFPFLSLLQPIQRIPAPDKEPHCLFYYKENPSMCEPRRTCDWLALSPCDYLHFIQSGRCTGTKSSAGYSPSSIFLSLSLILFKHPTHCKRSSVLENYILWHQFQFSLQCQVSLTHSIFRLVSKWHHKSINVSMIVCVGGSKTVNQYRWNV